MCMCVCVCCVSAITHWSTHELTHPHVQLGGFFHYGDSFSLPFFLLRFPFHQHLLALWQSPVVIQGVRTSSSLSSLSSQLRWMLLQCSLVAQFTSHPTLDCGYCCCCCCYLPFLENLVGIMALPSLSLTRFLLTLDSVTLCLEPMASFFYRSFFTSSFFLTSIVVAVIAVGSAADWTRKTSNTIVIASGYR